MIIYKHTCIHNVMLVLFYAKVPFKNYVTLWGGGSVTSVMHIMHINEYKAWQGGGGAWGAQKLAKKVLRNF